MANIWILDVMLDIVSEIFLLLIRLNHTVHTVPFNALHCFDSLSWLTEMLLQRF